MSDILINSGDFDEREIIFDKEDEGKRLDAALTDWLPDLSRSRIQSIIDAGLVRPEGLSKNTRVKAGDRVSIRINKQTALTAAPEDIEIDIVYEDEAVIVVDKARGMVVHPARGSLHGTLVNALLGRHSPAGAASALSGVSGSVRPGIVHRIDKNTSGLLVIAKTNAAHMALSAQFSAHSITRRYMAIVLGGFKNDEGTVDAPIGRDPNNRKKNAILPGRGRRAVTHWRVAERLPLRPHTCTLLELELETGRTHQIRVHMASIGHPVLGDDLYGAARGPAALEGQYLHACVLGFDHPATGERLEFQSPLPAYFEDMLTVLRRGSVQKGRL